MPEVLIFSSPRINKIYISSSTRFMESTPFPAFAMESVPVLGSFAVQFGDHLRACEVSRSHFVGRDLNFFSLL